MNDLFNDPKLHSGLVAGIVSAGIWLVRWLVKREISRNDQRIAAVEKGLANGVKRTEFEQLRADGDQRHRENSERLERIEDATTGTHRRIDELFLKMPEWLQRK